MVLGLFSLILSLSNRHQLKPKIILSKLELIRKNPLQIKEWYEHKSREHIVDHMLDFQLNLILKNKGGGQVSVEKPSLLFIMPSGKQIRAEPFVISNQPGQDTPVPSAWTIPVQKETSWSLSGGQILQKEVRYVISDINDLYEIVDNYSLTAYAIEYSDGLGKKYTRDIISVFEEK